jgi:hypothetical protein
LRGICSTIDFFSAFLGAALQEPTTAKTRGTKSTRAPVMKRLKLEFVIIYASFSISYPHPKTLDVSLALPGGLLRSPDIGAF